MQLCTCNHPDQTHTLIAERPAQGIGDPTIAPNRRTKCTVCSCEQFTPKEVQP